MNELSRIMLVSHIAFCLIHDATAKPSAYGRSVSSTTISGVFCRIISHAFVPFDVLPTSSSSLLACISRFVCFSRDSSAHASKIRILSCLIFIYCFPRLSLSYADLRITSYFYIFSASVQADTPAFPRIFIDNFRQNRVLSVECPVFSQPDRCSALLCETA